MFDRKTLKGSQFSQPLVEFSGACAGCGETPYAKLITQLYGEKTYWVNGVGCSLAWAGAFPSLPYTKNKEGRGPAFYGTLFEDQAENGLGVVLAVKQRRAYVKPRWLSSCCRWSPARSWRVPSTHGWPPSTIWMPTMPMPAS